MEWIRAGKNDFEAVAAFYRHVIDHTEHMDIYARWIYGQHPSDKMIMDYITSGFMYMMKESEKITAVSAVADRQEANYRPVAWGIDTADDEVAVLHILCTDPYRTGEGIGTRMLEAIYENAKRDGKKAVRLDTFAANLPAQHLYEKNGYIKRGNTFWNVDDLGIEEFYLYEKII